MSYRSSTYIKGVTVVLATAVIATLTHSVGRAQPQGSSAGALAVVNGHIYTGDPKQPFVEAMAVRDGKIAAVGSTADIQKNKPANARVLDLGGKTALPGFIDSHTHTMWGSMALYGINLSTPERTISPATQPQEFVAAIKAYAAQHPKDKIIFGRASFSPVAATSKDLLDQAVPDRPLVVHNTSEHSLWVNSKALAMAGITNKPVANAEEDKGIFRNPDGSPSGVIRELSMEVIERAVLPMLTQEEKLNLLKAGQHFLNSFGITTTINATGDLAEIELYGTLRDRNQLTVRTRTAFGAVAYPHKLTTQFLKDLEAARTKYHDDMVSANLVKFFADGASGPWPPIYTPQQFKDLIFEIDSRGYQIMTHALRSDSATMVLDGYEALEAAHGKKDRRLRMEHAGSVTPQDVPRFGKLSVAASMQPMFCCGPEGAATVPYQAKSVIDSGATVIFSSDWPCSWPPSPLQGMQQAMTRKVTRGTEGGFNTPSERLSLAQALDAYTKNSAYEAFMDTKIGTLEVGKYADFVVISADIFSVRPEAIAATRVLDTVLGGQTVYSVER
jgi:predicted amidohydrolase YtcJ